LHGRSVDIGIVSMQPIPHICLSRSSIRLERPSSRPTYKICLRNAFRCVSACVQVRSLRRRIKHEFTVTLSCA
jgi:hypothetical protein